SLQSRSGWHDAFQPLYHSGRHPPARHSKQHTGGFCAHVPPTDDCCPRRNCRARGLLMSTYKVKTGHDNALNTLSDITPQPRTDATTQPVQRTDAASGAIHEQGLWIALQWSMIETASEYQTL